MFKILPVARRALDRLFHEGCVFRMDALENAFHGRRDRSVILEDAKRFLRPADLAGGHAPPEAARMTELLRFRQVRVSTLLGALTRDENAGRVLQRHRSQQRILVIIHRHHCTPRSVAASAVVVPGQPRAPIFAKAVSRLVEMLSKNGENPQSSVVPS